MIRIQFAAALLLLAFSASSAHAELLTFDLEWSGASFDNNATATGSITIDDTVLPNPSNRFFDDTFANLGITSFTITVSGAETGNGTFTEADFTRAFWGTGNISNAALDLTTELVGQLTSEDPWGTSSGIGGGFTVFSPLGSGAPTATNYFQLTTAEGNGDNLQLTKFTRTNFVPPELQTFDLQWSGASFGNNATATGSITIDDTLLPNPSNGIVEDSFANLGITSFTITVSGADTGNGTFTEADFDRTYWDTGNIGNPTLDLTAELVGQLTVEVPWGSPNGNGGGFTLFSTSGSGAPTATNYFQIATAEGSGDELVLTNFTPVVPLILGDCNLDGVVNFFDISQFISFLFVGYQSEADINEDGIVDFLDIGPFIALLSS